MVNTNNLCVFEGRVAKDPQFSQINGQNGPIDKVVFDLAVDRGMSAQQRQNAQANQQQTADFIHCSMIGNQVNAFRQYCPKGKAVKVLCHYTQYTYTDKQTGQTQYGHQFDVDNFGFTTADAKALGDGNNGGGYQQNNGYNQNNGGNYGQNNGNYGGQPNNNYGNNKPQNNGGFMNAPQPQSNFEMFSDNPASPF
jgi:single-strand DNA-binding protein